MLKKILKFASLLIFEAGFVYVLFMFIIFPADGSPLLGPEVAIKAATLVLVLASFMVVNYKIFRRLFKRGKVVSAITSVVLTFFVTVLIFNTISHVRDVVTPEEPLDYSQYRPNI